MMTTLSELEIRLDGHDREFREVKDNMKEVSGDLKGLRNWIMGVMATGLFTVVLMVFQMLKG